MAISFSTDAIAELNECSPDLYIKTEIIKNYYGTPTTIDITDRVLSYGNYMNMSTLRNLNWELPAMTIELDNSDDYFHEGYASSIWDTSPAKEPQECLIKIQLYAKPEDKSSELMLEYLGRINDIKLKLDDQFASAELFTFLEVNFFLDKYLTKREGPYSVQSCTSPYTETRNNIASSICIEAPDVQSIDLIGTFPGGSPFKYYQWTISKLSALALQETKIVSNGEVREHQTKFNFINLYAAGTNNVDLQHTTTLLNLCEVNTYNPVQYNDHNPADIVSDLIRYIAGVDSSLVNAASFSSLSSYFDGLTYPLNLYSYHYDKTISECILDIISYAPEMFLRWSYNSKIYADRIGPYSAEASPLHYTMDESGDVKIVSIVEEGTNEDRLGTELHLDYGAFVHKDIWLIQRDATIAVKQGGGSDLWHYYSRSAASPTPKKEKILDLKKPFFNIAVANYRDVISNFFDTRLDLFSLPIKYLILDVALAGLRNEIGDIIKVTIPGLNYAEKKFLIVGKEFNYDTFLLRHHLFDLELT